ncbi:MAG: aldo/keto reductase [Anaerolineales bacterium]|nr:aldo/keto reductase [Anaerolineales bacterium]
MDKRLFGRTGHPSTLAIFGAAALYQGTPQMAEQAMHVILQAGVNHIDIAPGYGKAEKLMGPWIEKTRRQFFLGCKTSLRTKTEAAGELRRSLELLRTDKFDLHQLHGITTFEELDQVTGPGGALEALIEAKEEGLTDYIGITGHGNQTPAIFLESLRRYEFDSVLFPVNFVQFGSPEYKAQALELLSHCQEKNIGVMAIKAVAARPWGEQEHKYNCWYQPFDAPPMIQKCVDFALSQKGVTGLCTTGDINILPLFLDACRNFTPMGPDDQEELITSAASMHATTIFDN